MQKTLLALFIASLICSAGYSQTMEKSNVVLTNEILEQHNKLSEMVYKERRLKIVKLLLDNGEVVSRKVIKETITSQDKELAKLVFIHCINNEIINDSDRLIQAMIDGDFKYMALSFNLNGLINENATKSEDQHRGNLLETILDHEKPGILHLDDKKWIFVSLDETILIIRPITLDSK